MLLAPFSLLDSSALPRHRASRSGSAIPVGLLAWAAIGTFTVLVVPAAWDNALAGYSLPFWLIGAPFINMLWLSRVRWFGHVRSALSPSGRSGARTKRGHSR